MQSLKICWNCVQNRKKLVRELFKKNIHPIRSLTHAQEVCARIEARAESLRREKWQRKNIGGGGREGRRGEESSPFN